jgi:hypothetical protein
MAIAHDGEPQIRERSEEWIENRIAHLTERRKDFKRRDANVVKEIESRKKELAGMRRASKKSR